MKEEIVCIDKNLYLKELPGTSFSEARGIVLGRYMEKEIGIDLEKKIQEHLNGCDNCAQLLKDLEDSGTFKTVVDRIPVAICPSSKALDEYLFNRKILSSEQRTQIEQHLQECPLCKEETNWLRNLEDKKIVDFSAARNKWLQPIFAAAAVCFIVLSAVLLWQRGHSQVPEEQLRALAVVHEPDEINFENLDLTSIRLPPDLKSTYDEAKSLLKQRKFRDAAGRLESIVNTQPNHSASVYLLGYCYYYLNQPEMAFALCDRAEQMHPHSIERCLSLVNIALKTGHFGRAVKEINGLYHEAPNVPEIRDLYQRITALTRGRTVKL